MRRAIALAGFGTLLAMIVGSGSASADSSRTDLKNYQHVFVIMMENTGYNLLIGNPNAPWINSAAGKYGLATSYFGVTHPSQPNYIASTAGIQGADNDNNEILSVPNIVDQLETHGKTWKAYMQSYSLCTDPLAAACGDQLYERKHNPFVTFADVQSSPARMANIVDLSHLNTDLAAGTVPDYVWISPDQCHDMHGRSTAGACNFGNEQGLIATGDAFLSSTVGAIMSSSAWTGNSAIFIMWDESGSRTAGSAALATTPDAATRSPARAAATSCLSSSLTPTTRPRPRLSRTTTTRCCARSRMAGSWAASASPATPRTCRR